MKTKLLPVVILLICVLATNLGTAVAQSPDPGTEPQSPQAVSSTLPAKLPWSVQTLDAKDNVDVGSYPSIAFDSGTGTPYISYFDATAKQLKLASPVGSGGNCGVANSYWCRTVEALTNVGRYSSIAIQRSAAINWRLGIAYINDNTHGLRYAQWACSFIHCGWTYWDIYHQSNFSVTAPSLKIGTDGIPQISFHYLYAGHDYLAYTKWVGSGGNCTDHAWQCSSLFSGAGIYSSLALTSSNMPVVAAYESVNGNLILATSITPVEGFTKNCGPGNNTWYCYSIDATGDVGLRPSLVMSDDYPYIVYYDKTNGKIKYAHWVGQAGSGNCAFSSITTAFEWKCDNFATIGSVSGDLIGLSIGLDNQANLVVAYMDTAEPTTQLIVARQVKAYYPGPLLYKHDYGNCGNIVLAGSVIIHQWICQNMDNGFNQYTYEAEYAAVAINPAGLAYVAYTEWDDYAGKCNLKLASQHFPIFLPSIKN